MGRHLKHCKRGSGKGVQQKQNNNTHTLPTEEGTVTTNLAPRERYNTHPRKPEHQLRRKGKKLSKQIGRLEQEVNPYLLINPYLFTSPANTATDAVASSSTGVEQHRAADNAASYHPVDLESSTSEDLPDYREEGAEFSAGGSPAAEDPCQ